MANTVRDIDQHYWRSRMMPYLTVRTTYNSIHAYKAHSHSELSIGIIQSGATCLTLAEQHITLNKGDIVLIEPGKVHACNPIDGIPRSYFMLYIDKVWCCKILSELYGVEVTQFRCDRRIFSSGTDGKKLAGLIPLLLKQESEQLACETESEIFGLLSRHCSPTLLTDDDGLACEIKNRLIRDIAGSPSLNVISQEMGRTPESLIRSFKNRFGITPKSFLNNIRVGQAKRLLKSGMSIADTAVAVGFSDQSQLHRAFVNYTASTPRQYQQGTSIFDNKS